MVPALFTFSIVSLAVIGPSHAETVQKFSGQI
jgi:hypothetical protein